MYWSIEPIVTQSLAKYVCVFICSLMMSVQSHDLLVTFYFPNRLGDEQM